MPGEHSRFSPSSAERWMACPPSTLLGEMAPPEKPSPYAEEGTRAHALLERCIKEQRYPHSDEGDDAQMREAVTEAADYVFSRSRDAIFVESERRLPMAYGDGEFGTADVTILDAHGCLEIVDFKYGAGVWVPVVDNWQMVAYLGAAALRLKKSGGFAAAYRATIIQPRAGGKTVRSWDFEDPNMLDLDVAAMHYGRKNAQAFDSKPYEEVVAALNPGETQCRFCNAKLICPAQKRLALDAAAKAFAGVKVQGFADVAEHRPDWGASGLSQREVAEIVAATPVIRSWLKDVEAEALDRAKAGHLIPGHKLVEAKARREYLHEDPDMNALMLSSLTGGALAPKAFMRPADVVAMTEAEKKLKSWASEDAPKGQKREAAQRIADAFADMLDKKSSGKLELVPEEDPRPAVNPGRDFAGVVVPSVGGPFNPEFGLPTEEQIERACEDDWLGDSKY